MTTKKQVSRIISDIEVGLLYQKEDNWLDDTRRLKGYLDGKYPKEYDTPYVVSTALSLLGLIRPNLYYTDPVFHITCKKEDIIATDNRITPLHIPGYLAASLQEDILNAIFPMIKASDEFKKGIDEALLSGYAVFKTGLTTVLEADNDNKFLPKKTVFLTCIPSEDVPYDPMATGSFDNCAFIAHRITKEVDQVKKDKDLKNTDLLEGFTVAEGTPKGDLYKSVKRKSMRKYITLYEYQDQIEDKVYLIAYDTQNESPQSSTKKKTNTNQTTTQNHILKEFPKDKAYKASDFTLLRFMTVDDRIRGISLIKSQEDQILAINQIFTTQLRHISMFGGILVYERGALSEDQLLAWQYSRQGDMLETEPNSLTQGRVKRESPLQMGADYFNTISTFTQIIDRGIGIQDFQQIYNTKRKTATESSFEQGETRIRRDSMLFEVSSAITTVAHKLLALVHKHYSLKEVEELVGYPIPKDLWTAVSKYELYQLDIDVSSMVVYNQSMANGLMQATNYLASNPLTQSEVMKLDGHKIAARIFQGFGANIDYFRRDDEPIIEEQNPERENDDLRDGNLVPSPQPFEPHMDHVKIHNRLYLELISKNEAEKAQRTMDHIGLHQFYQQALEQMQGGQQSPINAQGQGGNVPMNNAGQEQPLPDGAELNGNFRR